MPSTTVLWSMIVVLVLAATTTVGAVTQIDVAYEETVMVFEPGLTEQATIGSTFDRPFPFATSPPTSFFAVAPLYVCNAATVACTRTLPTDALMQALLDSQEPALQLGPLERRYTPDIQPRAVLEKCPIGFETGRGFDVHINSTMLYGIQPQGGSPQGFEICNEHRLGTTAFRFLDDQDIWSTGYYIKVWAPGARNVYLTGSFNQRTVAVDNVDNGTVTIAAGHCAATHVERVWVHPRDSPSPAAPTFDVNAGTADINCIAGVSQPPGGLVPCNRQMRMQRAPVTPEGLAALIANPPVTHPYPYTNDELALLREGMFEPDVFHMLMVTHGDVSVFGNPWGTTSQRLNSIVIERAVTATNFSLTVQAELNQTTQRLLSHVSAVCSAALSEGQAGAASIDSVAQQVFANDDVATPIPSCLCCGAPPPTNPTTDSLLAAQTAVDTAFAALVPLAQPLNTTAATEAEIGRTVGCLLSAAGVFDAPSVSGGLTPLNRTGMLAVGRGCRARALAVFGNLTTAINTTHPETLLSNWLGAVQQFVQQAIQLTAANSSISGNATAKLIVFKAIAAETAAVAAQLGTVRSGLTVARELDALRVASVVPEAATDCMHASSIRDVYIVAAGVAASKLNGTQLAQATPGNIFNDQLTLLVQQLGATQLSTDGLFIGDDDGWMRLQALKVASEAATAATNASLSNATQTAIDTSALQSGLRGLLILTRTLSEAVSLWSIDGVTSSVRGIASLADGSSLLPSSGDVAGSEILTELLGAVYDLTCDGSDTTPLTSCANGGLGWSANGQSVLGGAQWWAALGQTSRGANTITTDAAAKVVLATIVDEIQTNLTAVTSARLLCSLPNNNNNTVTFESSVSAALVHEDAAENDIGLCWIGVLLETLAVEVQTIYNNSTPRFFSQNPDVRTTGVVLQQTYPYDTTTDIINPWFPVPRSHMPLQNFGVLPAAPAVSTPSSWWTGEAGFVVADKPDQLVYRLDVRTFTPAGTLVAAAARLVQLYTNTTSSSNCDANVPEFVPFNTVQLLSLYEQQPAATAGALFPWVMDAAVGTWEDLRAFINVCHALGKGVLVETRENSLLASPQQSIFYQFDLIVNTVDVIRLPDASPTSPPPTALWTYINVASNTSTDFTLALFVVPQVLHLVADLHDQYILRTHADGIVHDLFTPGADTCAEVCIPVPPATQVVLDPSCNSTVACPVLQPPTYCILPGTLSTAGILVMQHYLPAIYLFQSPPAQGVVFVLASALPCCVRHAERDLYALGSPSFKYYTDTGVQVFACDPSTQGVSPGYDCTVQDAVAQIFVHANFLRYPDADAYEWLMPPPTPAAINTLPAPSTSLASLSALYAAATLLPPVAAARFSLAYWQGVWIRTRLLSGNTAVFVQGFELLYPGVVTSSIAGNLGTFLAGSVCSVVSLRTTHPSFFNAAANRNTMTAGWHMFNNQSQTLMDTLFDNSFPEPGTQLDWVVIARPGTCPTLLQPSSSQCVLLSVTDDGTSSRFLCPACVEREIVDYMDVPFEPLTASHVHAFINHHPNNSITITMPLPVQSSAVVLVGGQSQCQHFYSDDSLGHQTLWDSKLQAAEVKDLFVSCLLPPTSLLVFKAVFNPGLPDPDLSLSTTDATTGLYGLAKLDEGFVGWNTATHTPLWLDHCPPGVSLAAAETCAESHSNITVVVAAGIRHSNSPLERVICGLPFKSDLVGTVPCTERRLGSTYFQLGVQPNGDTRGLFLQLWAPVSHKTVEGTWVQSVQVEFIRLLRSPNPAVVNSSSIAATAGSNSTTTTTNCTVVSTPVVLSPLYPNFNRSSGYAVLAAAGITNTGHTNVTADVGSFPTASITGFPPGVVVAPGTLHNTADTATANARTDASAAYLALQNLVCTDSQGVTDIGGTTMTPGVHCYTSSLAITGVLTLNAQGNSSAIFIFTTGSTLTTATGASIVLINGAQPYNVFFAVGSSATIQTGTAFVGNILAATSITFVTGATTTGRVFAGMVNPSGAVTLDTVSLALSSPPAGPTNATVCTNTTTTVVTPGTTPAATCPDDPTTEPVTAQVEICPAQGEQIQWLQPNLVFNLTRDGDYWLGFLRVQQDLLNDLDRVTQQGKVRLEYRYAIQVMDDATGLNHTLYRVDPYSKAVNSLTRAINDTTALLNTSTTILTTVLEPPLEEDFRQLTDVRMAERTLVDSMFVAEAAREAVDAANQQHPRRLFYGITPQLSLEVNASDPNDVARARVQPSSSNAFMLLHRGYVDDIRATDIELSGMFSAYSELASSAWMPFTPVAELHGIRRDAPGEAPLSLATVNSSSSGNATWQLTQPFGFNPNCIAQQDCRVPQPLAPDCLPGVAANMSLLGVPTWGVVQCCEWNRGLYELRREGYAAGPQWSMAEFIHEAHINSKHVVVQIEPAHLSLFSPIVNFFSPDQSEAASNNLGLPGGEYFTSDTALTGGTSAVESYWYSNGNPRLDISKAPVEQYMLDWIRYLVEEQMVDAVEIDVDHFTRTDPLTSVGGVQLPIPRTFEFLTRACALVHTYDGVECIVTDSSLSDVVGADMGFDVSIEAAAAQEQSDDTRIWHLRNIESLAAQRLASIENSRITLNATQTMAILHQADAFALMALEFAATGGFPFVRAGQEFMTNKSSTLAVGFNPFNIFRGPLYSREDTLPSQTGFTVNNIGYPPQGDTSTAAGRFLAKSEEMYKIYSDSTDGLGGSRIDIYQNCSCYTALRKWSPIPVDSNITTGAVDYIVENLCETWEVVSFFLDTDDRQSVFELEFTYPNNTAAAHNCSQLINGTTVQRPFIIHCYLGPGSVLIYRSTSAPTTSPLSAVEDDHLLLPIGLDGRQVIPNPCANAFPQPEVVISSSTGIAQVTTPTAPILTWWAILLIVLAGAIFLAAVIYYLCFYQRYMVVAGARGGSIGIQGGAKSAGYRAVAQNGPDVDVDTIELINISVLNRRDADRDLLMLREDSGLQHRSSERLKNQHDTSIVW